MFSLYITEDRAHWLNTDGTLAEGTLGEAADVAQKLDVLVLVPAESILLSEVALPPIRQPARRLNAAKYALEDHLAARVETLHFALADKGSARSGGTSIAVMDLDRMRLLMRTLTEAGINAKRVAPDVLALPEPGPDEWRVCSIGARILARTGRDAGFACTQGLWPALAAGAQAPVARVTIQADDDDTAAIVAEGDIPGAPEIDQRPVQSADVLITAMLTDAATRASFNLCQGEFAHRSSLQRWWQPFRATAALAAICLVLLLGVRGVETYQLHNRIETLHQRSIAIFRNAFPGVRNINNLRAQALQEIALLRSDDGSAGIYSLLQATAEVTSATSGITLQTMQYRDGKLILSLEGDTVQALEALRAGFARQPQVELQVERADAAGGGVRIRASVSSA